MDDEAFADNHAERDQAKALRAQARTAGLHFEVYLPPAQADWLLEWIEQGHFVDPCDGVVAIVKNFIDLELHRDLSDELLRRMLAQAAAELAFAYGGEERRARLEARHSRDRPDAAHWEEIAR